MSTNPARSNQTSQTTLTPPQLEARTILTHLLTRLSQPKDDDTATNPRYDEYSAWINQHSIPTLTTSLYSMIRPQLWTLLSSRLSLDALKHVGGDLRLETRGAIYFNGILGVDKRLRISLIKGEGRQRRGVVGGLNVATPLDQGVEVKDMPFVDLSGEVDPVIRDYLREVKRRKGDVQQVENVKIKDGTVEVDEEERALRKKIYAEKARRYSKRRDTDIVIPQWVFLGAVAVGVGVLLFRSSGGPGNSARWR
ncbi:unnamed protein product [Alternaria alternata]